MIEYNEQFWIAISFIILLFISFKYVKNYLKNLFDNRAKSIEKEIAESVEINEKATKLLVDFENKEKFVEEIISDLLNDAKKRADSILNNNLKEIESIKDRKIAHLVRKIKEDRNQAIREIKQQVISLSISIITDIIQADSKKNSLMNLNKASIEKLKLDSFKM